MGRRSRTKTDLELAFSALAKLVRDEFPSGYRLAKIAFIWGAALGVTDEEIAALDRLEEGEPYLPPNSR